MSSFKRFLGKMCDDCRICNYARNKPESWFGKLMAWHGKWCPAWKAQQELERERQGASKSSR